MRSPFPVRTSGGVVDAALRRFRDDEDGFVLPLATMMLLTFIGGALLAVDGARLSGLQTDLQKAADAAALAAAAELDRRPSAIDRATAAATNLVVNRQIAGLEAGPVRIGSLRFLAALPPSDDDPITAAHVTADPADARFVEVTVAPVTLGTVFPAALFGAQENRVRTGAVAVAGQDQAVCDFTPVYICNPFEGSGISLTQAMNDPSVRRRLIQLKAQGSGASYFPGNFGFLQPPGGRGANEIRDMIAQTRPPACFLRSGVELRTGAIASVRSAVNVRFDMYEADQSRNKNDERYRPALNVRKGYVAPGGGKGGGGKADPCNAAPTNDPTRARGLTRDLCFDRGTCAASSGGFSASMQGRIGDGRWDFDGYWSVNHGSRPKPVGPGGATWSNAAPPSRYDVHRYEIDNGLVGSRSPGGETGTPACYGGPAPTDSPDRRLLYGAVLDCLALNDPANGGPIRGGSSDPLPVAAFARFFITEPVASGPEDTIWVEMVDVFEPGVRNDVSRDLVQLYR